MTVSHFWQCAWQKMLPWASVTYLGAKISARAQMFGLSPTKVCKHDHLIVFRWFCFCWFIFGTIPNHYNHVNYITYFPPEKFEVNFRLSTKFFDPCHLFMTLDIILRPSTFRPHFRPNTLDQQAKEKNGSGDGTILFEIKILIMLLMLYLVLQTTDVPPPS